MSARQYDLRPAKRRTRATLALCVVAALPLAGGMYQTQVALADEQQQLLLALGRLKEQRRALDSQALANGRIGPGRADAPQHVLGAFLERLENTWRDDLGLLRVEVDPLRKRASLQVRVESPQRLLDFVARLRAALGSTAQVALARHDTASDAGRWPVAANVTVQWL